MKELDQAARNLAARGEATVGRVAAIVERARELLEADDIQPTPDEDEPYAWEAHELFLLGTPLQIYLATVEDFATGEGLTISFFAGGAQSANAFRRSIAREVGVHLAAHAIIAEGTDAKTPFGKVFLSDALKTKLEQIGRGEDQPGVTGATGNLATERRSKAGVTFDMDDPEVAREIMMVTFDALVRPHRGAALLYGSALTGVCRVAMGVGDLVRLVVAPTESFGCACRALHLQG